MTAPEHPRVAGRHDRLQAALDRDDVAGRIDETDPLPADGGADLSWAREDPAHTGTVQAAEQGDLTPDETLEEVASALGYRERTIDEDDYDR